MLNRRSFLKVSAATGAAAFLSTRMRFLQRVLAQGIPLPGSAIPQFIDPLPLLDVAGGPMETVLFSDATLTMQEFRASVMPSAFVPANGQPYTGTWVWGYRHTKIGDPINDTAVGTYIGPVFVTARGTPTQIKFVNELTANNIAWREWTDQTLHWADPLNGEANMCAHMGGPATGDCLSHYDGPIPAVPHLHGGEVPPVVDGGPDAWFTNGGDYHGHAYYTLPGVEVASNEAVYRYLNTQEAAMIWFHDHVLGATRVNVYAGLAGAYALIDPSLSLPTGLHPVGLQQGAGGSVDYLVPLVIQDRSFDTNGQFIMPNIGINPEHPYWVPEFVGDTIVVNGKVWPFLNVDARRYRFLIINGSNARTYELFLVNPATKVMGPPIWQIGTDGGYLDTPVKIDPNVKPLDKLTIMPGERADIIIDFAGLAGQTLLLRNTGRTPYPKGTSPQGTTLGQIMQFRVGPGPAADASYNPASGVALRSNNPIIRLVNPATGTLAAGVTANKTRQMTLNEVMGPGGPLEVLVNNTKWDGMRINPTTGEREPLPGATSDGHGNYLTELPDEGATEVWEIINLTADAHPIHTHLTQFQLINRQKFNTNKYNGAYNALFPASVQIDPMTNLPYPGGVFIGGYGPPSPYTTPNADGAVGGNPAITPYLQGPAQPPKANEAGWKDTVIMFPGEVTRFAVRYAPLDKALSDPDLYYPFDPNALGHGYVWHCHIIDHEDNEMMRPYAVNAKNVTRDKEQGTDY